MILYTLLTAFSVLLLTLIPSIVSVQYASLFSFCLLLVLIIPAVILGLMGKRIREYGLIISLYGSCLAMSHNFYQLLQFLCFVLLQIFLVKWYTKHKRFYRSIFLLSVLPIVLVKISQRASGMLGGYSFVGFIGISYISFRVWQLLFEAHDNKLSDFSFFDVLYFLIFFPTLTSGPIDRYDRFCGDLNREISQNEYIQEYLMPGLKRFLYGLAYKFGISSVIKIFILDKVSPEITFVNVLIYMYAYTFFLFFDFAGYSNFAIGTSYMLGIKAPENFNKPFLSRNMKEFWERWHISLSKWFGDYVFSRFVLNVLRTKKLKSKKTAVRAGYMFTMTLMGLWHGFYLFYVLYGVYQGLLLVLTDIYIKSKTFQRFRQSRYYDPVSRVICFHMVSFGMLIFSGYLFKI